MFWNNSFFNKNRGYNWAEQAVSGNNSHMPPAFGQYPHNYFGFGNRSFGHFGANNMAAAPQVPLQRQGSAHQVQQPPHPFVNRDDAARYLNNTATTGRQNAPPPSFLPNQSQLPQSMGQTAPQNNHLQRNFNMQPSGALPLQQPFAQPQTPSHLPMQAPLRAPTQASVQASPVSIPAQTPPLQAPLSTPAQIPPFKAPLSAPAQVPSPMQRQPLVQSQFQPQLNNQAPAKNAPNILPQTAPQTPPQAHSQPPINTLPNKQQNNVGGENVANNGGVLDKLKNVGTFMGYPEYTLADAPAADESSKNLGNTEIELKELCQGEKNGAQFYRQLSALARDGASQKSLISIADRAEKRCGKLAQIFNGAASASFVPETKKISPTIDYYTGLKHAITEESKALKSLSESYEKIFETSVKRQLNEVIIEKLCQINELNLLL